MQKILRDNLEIDINSRLPVLPLKEVVLFPYMIFPLLVGREASLRAIQEAMVHDKLVFLASQRDVTKEDPGRDDVYRVGVVSRILQVLKLPNGLMKVLVEGLVRGRIARFLPVPDHLEARIEVMREEACEGPQMQAIMRRVTSLFREYVHLNRNIPDEVLLALESIEQPHHLADYVAAYLQREVKVKQQILEIPGASDQLLELAKILESEREILEMERTLEDKVRGRLQKSQRTFWLQEQMRAIQEELGEEGEGDNEMTMLRDKIKKARMSKEAAEKALEELEKLRNTAALSPEATVIRNYLDWLVAVPWQKKTRDNIDIEKARRILEEDHYGLEKPKERILEHLAVLKLVKEMKGPILCFVGPPGVGKTSLAKSVARAMGRNFVRVSLGGVRDEAEIRGHRRTYIGSLPGKIIQSMKKAKTINPVFLLDEVDKMSVDFRGDPSAALLEVLDPEQNRVFSDHYLEVDYDLSKVLFITTANVRSQIPEPLQDRMEIINLPGYLEHDKLEIARGFLIPKLLRDHGLRPEEVSFTTLALRAIIRDYTREAGVRNLERELGAICRKVARNLAAGKGEKQHKITPTVLAKFLGVPKFPERKLDKQLSVGTATGLAWTRFGGDVLEVEVNLMKGKGHLTLTGKLGEVMKESAKAALSYARTNAETLGIAGDFWNKFDIHLHIPEGAIPKDGPSAGITLATALISALCGRPVRRDIAMTGEITLRGSVLAIGGLNEKMLAAQRHGLRRVIIPADNAKEVKELPAPLRRGMEILPVHHMHEVLAIALAPTAEAESAETSPPAAGSEKRKPARRETPRPHARLSTRSC